MPDPKDLKELLQLLAPGFVILGIRQWFIVGPPPKLSERALSYAAISAAYFAIVVPLVNVAGDKLYLYRLTQDALAYFAIPVAIGLGYSWIAEKGWPNRFWQFLRIAPVHRIPGAWDYAFRQTGVSFIIVTLNDGSRVSGLYGEGSFASSDREKRDILISRVYDIDSSGNWTEATPTKRILLCGGNIQAIEFFGG